jgi:hypothetical protein
MELSAGVFFRLRMRAAELALLLGATSVILGCVNLDKPAEVGKCSAMGNCLDQPDTLDAKAGSIGGEDSRADSRKADISTSGRDDLGSGGSALPDAGSDKADSSGGTPNVADVGDSQSGTGRDASANLDVGSAFLPDAEGDDVGSDLGRDEALESADGGENDLRKDDVSNWDLPPETSSDGPSSCSIFYGANPPILTQGHPPVVGSTSAFCVATCDDIAGWGCYNCEDRVVTVNGTVVKIGDPIAKKNGYFVFEVGVGPNMFAGLFWWAPSNAWAITCSAPAGGF